VGVQLVEEVEPYEKMKVRLLNSSHSALAYLSYLLGHRQVDKAMADPLIGKFVRNVTWTKISRHACRMCRVLI
jgi:mannitol-1-phosphate/altronate dehydrogenase